MNRRKWLWASLLTLPLAVVGGLVFANAQKAQNYTCPVTGEELPCPKCCPLNRGLATTAAESEKPKAAGEDGYICPVTGEKLGCPRCCPLNQTK